MSGSGGAMISEQAQSFVGYWRRLGAAGRAGAFRRWARSKDFAPRMARRIARAVARQTGDTR
jgi:hypothetical protein